MEEKEKQVVQAMDGVFVIVQVGGNRVFERGIPLPKSYEDGKMAIMMVGADAMAALTGYMGAMGVRKKDEEIERLKGLLKGMEKTEENGEEE